MKKISHLTFVVLSTFLLIGCSKAENENQKSKESKIDKIENRTSKNIEAPKNISGILKTVSFAFNSNGAAVYDESTGNIVVNLNVNESNYSPEDFKKLKDQFKSSAKTAYDSIKKVYQTENPIVIKNSGKELFTVKSGEILDK